MSRHSVMFCQAFGCPLFSAFTGVLVSLNGGAAAPPKFDELMQDLQIRVGIGRPSAFVFSHDALAQTPHGLKCSNRNKTCTQGKNKHRDPSVGLPDVKLLYRGFYLMFVTASL